MQPRGRTGPVKWTLSLKVIPLVSLIVVLKFLAHSFQFEFLSLSPLFTAIISANIFLVGFLITGVLADYKESEKLPGDMACSLETMLDDGMMLFHGGKTAVARSYIAHIKNLSSSLLLWLHKDERTSGVMQSVSEFNAHYLAMAGAAVQPNFIVRLKQEQHQLRRMITRIHTIRETSFSQAGYAIVEIITVILALGLVFVRIDPFFESVFFVSFVSFIIIYMLLLIKDLDNPFGYYEADALSDEVSLKPLSDFHGRIEAVLAELEKGLEGKKI